MRFKELEPPEVDVEGYWYLQIFGELHRTRQQGMNGDYPITYLEIKAFVELHDIDLVPADINILKIMDKAYLQERNKPQEEQ